MKTNLLVMGAALAGCMLAASCSSDSDSPNGTAGTAGSAGTAGTGGQAGATGLPAPSNPHAVVVPQASGALATLLATTADYTTKTELAAITLGASPALQGAVTVADGDAVAKSSGGLGFLLERTSNKVDLIDAGAIKTTFDLSAAPVGGTPTNKAYVGLYTGGVVAVLDLDTGKVTSHIDLNEFNDASDSDGSPDIDSAVYDPASKIAYFTLARIDLNTPTSPTFQLACPSIKALVVGIDTSTDSVVDLNGSAAGKGIELELVNATSLSFDAAGKLLVISDAGCYASSVFAKSGVEVIDLSTGTAHVAYASPNGDYLSEVIATGSGQALLHTSDSAYLEHWYQLDLDTGTLGVELTNVPSAVSWDGSHLLGVDATTLDITSYDPTSGMSTQLIPAPWTANLSTATSSALAK
jgi:hypothetical protein